MLGNETEPFVIRIPEGTRVPVMAVVFGMRIRSIVSAAELAALRARLRVMVPADAKGLSKLGWSISLRPRMTLERPSDRSPVPAVTSMALLGGAVAPGPNWAYELAAEDSARRAAEAVANDRKRILITRMLFSPWIVET